MLWGCTPEPEEIITAKELYDKATERQNAADYDEATATYEDLVSTFPASKYAKQALLDQMAANLQRKEYEAVVALSDQLTSLYPNSEHLDYALYMKALAYFREDRGLLDIIGQQPVAERDMVVQKRSFALFRELVNRFPESRFVEDSIYRMRHLVNTFALSEIDIAEFYLEREMYSVTIRRAKELLKNYPDSVATERALELLLVSYEALGSKKGADEVREILKLNYPDNPLLN